MRVEQSGTISHIGETQEVTATFKKRLVVVEYQSGTYQNHLAAYVHQDRCALLDAVSVGDVATLVCDVRSNQGRDGVRWFTEAVCFGIDAETPTPIQKAGPAPVAETVNNDDIMGDNPPF